MKTSDSILKQDDKHKTAQLVPYAPDTHHAQTMFINAGVQAHAYFTLYGILRWIAIILAGCVAFSVGINFFQVVYTQYGVVTRYREVAKAELRQECCVIYDSSGERAWPKQKIEDCMRILAEDKQIRKVNRCEAAREIVDNVLPYQVILEVWGYYFPLSKMSFIDSIWVTIFGSGSITMMNTLLNAVGKGIKRLYF
jgi:cytochrome c oxidase subunit IV